MLKNFRKIFTKIKTKDAVDNDLYHSQNEVAKNIEVNDIEPFINGEHEDIKLDDIKETVTHNIVRTRLNAYVIKNKEEDFRLMDYDMDTGEVVWIEGKLFNNLRGLQRVRWSPSSGSATVYYGYISVEDSGDKLVSSVYIMNIIKDMIKKDSLGDIVYNIKNDNITINYKNPSETLKPKVFHIYGVSSVVEMEMLLNKNGLSLNRE